MKLEFDNEPDVKTIDEVVEHLKYSGGIPFGCEVMGYELEFGCDLAVEVRNEDGETHTITFYECDLRNEFSEALFVAWAKDESGESVLACFM